jgi:hypothetical protein
VNPFCFCSTGLSNDFINAVMEQNFPAIEGIGKA